MCEGEVLSSLPEEVHDLLGRHDIKDPVTSEAQHLCIIGRSGAASAAMSASSQRHTVSPANVQVWQRCERSLFIQHMGHVTAVGHRVLSMRYEE